ARIYYREVACWTARAKAFLPTGTWSGSAGIERSWSLDPFLCLLFFIVNRQALGLALESKLGNRQYLADSLCGCLLPFSKARADRLCTQILSRATFGPGLEAGVTCQWTSGRVGIGRFCCVKSLAGNLRMPGTLCAPARTRNF